MKIHEELLKQSLSFLDQQMLIQPALNTQIGFDFQGLRQSYRCDPKHPDYPFVARHSRIWIYDVALSIYADVKAGRLRQAGYQVGRIIQVAQKEEEKGFKGLWHFSYNTLGDYFIDPRGPAGANAWCLNAIYTFIVASGNTTPLPWANRAVQRYLFEQQVMDSSDPRYGLIRAGLHNAEDCARGEAMGYRVYEGDLNHPYEHVILEHNADAAGTFRLAFLATKRHAPGGVSGAASDSGSHAPQEQDFLKALIHRHDLLMRGMRRSFWQEDHFVSAIDEKGQFYLGTDGTPSIAVDNNTWAAHVFVPYDVGLAVSCARYVGKRFLIRTPPAQVEDLPGTSGIPGELQGLYYFPATFQDPFVQVAAEHRPKMEQIFQPEAAFGFVLFLRDLAQSISDSSERARLESLAEELYEHTARLLNLYGSSGFPYASGKVPAIFSTLGSVTTAATGVVVSAILRGAANHDFIGVTPPAEFLVNGQRPLRYRD